MQSFSEKFVLDSDLVMSWHAPCLPKSAREHSLIFTRPPSPLNLKTVQLPTHPHPLPTFIRVPPPPKKTDFSDFSVNSHYKIKVTKFLVKLSQFKFLVSTDNNIVL